MKVLFLSICFLCIIFKLSAQSIDKIIVGGDFDYPPYSYLNINGDPVGHDVDVMNRLSELIGFEIEYQFDHWDTTLNALRNNKIDVIAGIVFSEERNKKFDFTIPLHTEYYAIFCRKKYVINDITDLKDLQAVVLDGDIANDQFFKPMGLLGNHISAKSLPEAILLIEHGKGDYVVAPFPLGMEIIKKDKCKNVEVKGPPVLPSVYCLAVAKGNTMLCAKLNKGIEQLRNNGELKEIHKKWVRYKRIDDLYEQLFHYASWGLLILCIISLILVLWWWALRRQLVRKTEQIKEVEGFYKNIFNSMQEAVVVFTLEGDVVDANPVMLRLYDVSYEEMIQMNGRDLVDVENQSTFEDFLRSNIDNEIFYLETKKRTRNGQDIYLNIHVSKVMYRGDIHHMAMLRDVSKERVSALKIIKAQEESESASRTKSMFLSTMSHEIRTPLNAIIGFSKLLSDTELNSKQLDYNNKIGLSGQLLLDLINDVLDMTKIEAGKLDLESSAFNLKMLVNKIIDVQRVRANSKDVNIDLTISSNTPEIVVGDSLRLSQILLNLISNAVKFTNRGEVLVLIRAGKELVNKELTEQRVWFTIKDSGIGISPDKIGQLFTPFTQAESSNARKFGGTGLGLAISKHIVDLMNGELYVESQLGKGSIFSFFIDFKKSTSVEIVDEWSEPIASVPKLSDLRILLVEDNSFNAQIFEEQLSSQGAEVICAADGEKALEHLVEYDFDIILMDIELPGMDGFETTQRIKQYSRWIDIPIIALSAHAMLEEKEKAINVGMVDYLSKPVSLGKLVSTILFYTNGEITTKEKQIKVVLTGLHNFGGDAAMFERALIRFVKVYGAIPKQIEILLQENNVKELKTIVHNLKSGGGMIGANELSLKAQEVDQLIKLTNNVNKDKMIELMNLLIKTLSHIENQLNE